jgi:glycine/betaine/sarcosine/D-proline reductase family selenoprotein B
VLISTGGIVPKGNPNKLPSFNANKWAVCSIEGITDFKCGDWEQVHGGYDGSFANDDPDRVVPLDAAREFERAGIFGKLHNEYLYTVGNITSLDSAARFGKEIVQHMKKHSIDAAILTST